MMNQLKIIGGKIVPKHNIRGVLHMETKVIFDHVYKSFELYAKRSEKVLHLFSLSQTNSVKSFQALRDISFEVFDGETVGIVGLNGSGKSTVSNILGGVVQPTSGEITIHGETSLIAIAAGLNGNLTGLENIELKCMMHGLTKEKIREVTPSIVEFADIGDYIDQPVKDYSSGMKSRLGFSVSVHTDPEILIIDEALSVGDSTFTQKCLRKMEEFKQEGKTIFFISHSAGQMREFCDRVIWLHYGKMKEIGPAKEVVDHYQEFTKWFNHLSEVEKKAYKERELKNQTVEGTIERSNKPSENIRLLPSIMMNSAMIIFVVFFAILMIVR